MCGGFNVCVCVFKKTTFLLKVFQIEAAYHDNNNNKPKQAVKIETITKSGGEKREEEEKRKPLSLYAKRMNNLGLQTFTK